MDNFKRALFFVFVLLLGPQKVINFSYNRIFKKYKNKQSRGMPINKFEEEFNLIKENKYDNILEIGCAEGYFTRYLINISNKITALDISKHAIKFANNRFRDVKKVKFVQTDFFNFDCAEKYDLIVANEVLYYLYDNPRRYFFEKILHNFGILRDLPCKKYKKVANKLYFHLKEEGNLLISTTLKALPKNYTFSEGEPFFVNQMMKDLKQKNFKEEKFVKVQKIHDNSTNSKTEYVLILMKKLHSGKVTA